MLWRNGWVMVCFGKIFSEYEGEASFWNRLENWLTCSTNTVKYW